MDRVLEIHEMHQEASAHQNIMTEEEAAERLTRTSPLDYGGGKPEDVSSFGGQFLKRGDVCQLDPDRIGFPTGKTVPTPAASYSPEVDHYFSRPESMLRERTPEWEEERKKIPCYSDPRLKEKAILLALLAHMWVSNMLMFTDEIFEHVSMFTVIKSITQALGSVYPLIEQRLIFDGRRVNWWFRDPPAMRVTTPSQFSWVDLSAETRGGRQVWFFSGDIKCFYYHLGLPEWIAKYFGIPDVTSSELCEYLRSSRGIDVKPPTPNHCHVCVSVFLMGWSWACWAANSALQAALSSVVEFMRAEMRLLHGMSTPFFTVLGTAVLHYQYIDDFGGIVLLDLGAAATTEAAREAVSALLAECKRALNAWGLTVHKEHVGQELECLGVQTSRPQADSEQLVLRPTWTRYVMLEKGTRRIVNLGYCTVKGMERLVGHWIGTMLIARLSLSVFHAIYDWLRVHKGSTLFHRIWESVRGELAAACALLPLIRSVLSQAWWKGCYLSDASKWGGASLHTRASYTEVRKEARWAETKGWHVSLSDNSVSDSIWELLDRQAEGADWINLEEEEPHGTSEMPSLAAAPSGTAASSSSLPCVSRPEAEPFELSDPFGTSSRDLLVEMARENLALSGEGPLRRKPETGPLILTQEERRLRQTQKGALEIFSGTAAWSLALQAAGVPWVEAWDLDYSARMDLRSSSVQKALLGRIASGLYSVVHLSPPGSSFSRARRPQLRSWKYPNGLPWVTSAASRQKLTMDTALILFCVRVIEVCVSAGIWVSLDLPAGSLAWALPELLAVCRRTDLVVVRIDQCAYGSPWKKSIKVLTSCFWLLGLSRRCSCVNAHQALRGRDEHQIAWTARASSYPAALVREWARLLTTMEDWSRAEIFERTSVPEIDVALGGPGLPKKRKVPPCAHRWSKPGRWKRIAQARWKREEHINLLEARAFLFGVRHASRSPSRRGLRVLHLVDSEVVLGAVSKGRSSSWALNQLVRKVASHSLLWSTTPMMRFVPTYRNCADGPSRGKRIGVIPSPKFLKWQRPRR